MQEPQRGVCVCHCCYLHREETQVIITHLCCHFKRRLSVSFFVSAALQLRWKLSGFVYNKKLPFLHGSVWQVIFRYSQPPWAGWACTLWPWSSSLYFIAHRGYFPQIFSISRPRSSPRPPCSSSSQEIWAKKHRTRKQVRAVYQRRRRRRLMS